MSPFIRVPLVSHFSTSNHSHADQPDTGKLQGFSKTG